MFEQDFYNLVDVYLDAVFYPKCVNEIQTFQQEGWHYELNDPAEDITYKGRSLWVTCTFFREQLVPINIFSCYLVFGMVKNVYFV